jgi:exosortase E/protease (VPEID-CTERM system)
MSLTPIPVETAPPTAAIARPTARPFPVLRWGLLTALLLAEVMAVSMSFDAAARNDDPGWAGTVVAWSPSVLRWALVVGAAAAVLGAWFLGDAIRTAASTRHWPRAIALWVIGQLAAYATYVFVTARVLDPAALETPLGGWELAAWLLTGALTVGCWAAAVMPPGAWARLLWEARYVLLAAACISLATSLVAAVAREGWEALSRPTMWAAHGVLRTLTEETVYRPAKRELGTPRFWVTVGVPCSGYEGMGLITAYLGSYLYFFRRHLRFPRAFLLLPLGLAAIWVVNVVRIAVLIYIGDRVSPKLAVNGFHSQAGWIGFNLVALTLVYVAHRTHVFAKEAPPRINDRHPTAAYLSPLLAAVAIQMLSAAFAPEPAALYPIRALAAGTLLWYFWPSYDCLQATPVLAESRPLAGLAGPAWAVAIGGLVFLIWIALVPAPHPPDDAGELVPGLGHWPNWAVGLWLAARVIGFVLVTPLAEEIAFRGYLMRRLIAADFEAVPPGRFTWLSFLVSSAAFGLLHGHWLAGTLAGMGYALAVYCTGRVREAVIAHAVTNALLIMRMATVGVWSD